MGTCQKANPDKESVTSLLFQFIQEGVRVGKLQEQLQQAGHTISRESASRLVWDAIEDQRLRYHPPIDELLQHRLWGELRSCFAGLDDAEMDRRVRVVPTNSAHQIASEGAQLLLELIHDCWQHKKQTILAQDTNAFLKPPTYAEAIHIGFGGGITSALVARELASLMKEECLARPSSSAELRLPRLIIFHAMSGILANGNPEFTPNAFFEAFSDLPIDARFMSFPVPALIRKGQWQQLQKVDVIRETYARRQDLDILFGSGGHWGMGHKTLCDYVTGSLSDLGSLQEEWEVTMQALEKHYHCIGDILWQPISEHGPIPSKLALSVPCLLELAAFPHKIQQNHLKVLLLLGPCAKCSEPKERLLRAVAQYQPGLLTHLVVTTQTANAYIRTYGPSFDAQSET